MDPDQLISCFQKRDISRFSRTMVNLILTQVHLLYHSNRIYLDKHPFLFYSACWKFFRYFVICCLVDFLFIVAPIVGVCNCSMFCCTMLYVHSSIAIILMGKRELVALLNLSSWCLVMVEWLFLTVPWGCLRFVIFLDHTHYF